MTTTPTQPEKEAEVADQISPELAASLIALEAKLKGGDELNAALAAGAVTKAELDAKDAELATTKEALVAAEASVVDLTAKLAAGVQAALVSDQNPGGLAAGTITDGIALTASVSKAFRSPQRA